VCYQADQVLGADHFRFDTSTGLDPNDPATVNEDFDCADPDNIRRLETLANLLIDRNAAKLQQLIALL
jgi:hypothetical protein